MTTSSRSIAFGVVAVTALVLCVGVWLHNAPVEDAGGSQLSSVTETNEANEVASSTTVKTPAVAQNGQPGSSGESQKPWNMTPETSKDSSVTSSAMEDLREFNEESGHLDSHSNEHDKPNDVIGRPFPLSQSVIQTCTHPPGRSHCPHLAEFLADFAAEPREHEWAQTSESQLRKFIMSSNSGELTIRTIECRTTRCVIEVASRNEFFLGEIEKDAELAARLSRGIGDFGFEHGPNGERTIVTVLTFKRTSARL